MITSACVLMLVAALPFTQCYPWEPCYIIPISNCSCWDPDHPSISCSYLNATKIPQGLEEQHPIANVDFSNNRLKVIPNGTFQNLHIQHLDLSYNKGLELSSSSFSGLEESLLSLSLRGVGMRNSPPNVFGPLKNLRDLDLSNNRLLRVAHLKPLRSLKRLNLSGNMIFSWAANALAENVELEELDISPLTSNKVDCLRRLALLGGDSLSYLKVLRVSRCNLRFSRASMWKFLKLQALSLQHCSIEDIDINSSAYLQSVSHSLTSLDLSNNRLTTIPVTLIRPLVSLGHLDLSHNHIASVLIRNPPLPSLRTLDLSANRITAIPTKTMRQLSGLSYLNLDQNHLGTLTRNVLRDGLEMSLSDNPFVCDCRLYWLVDLAGKEISEGQPGPLSVHDIYTGIQCLGVYQGSSLAMLYNNYNYRRTCS